MGQKEADPVASIKIHYLPKFFHNPIHPIVVCVVGVGGNGSHVISSLAQVNVGLLARGHKGIIVVAWDQDIVTDANIGRQMFYRGDVGENKAKVLITRINHAYGFNWAWNDNNLKMKNFVPANIYITCVDSGWMRGEFYKLVLNYTRQVINRYGFKPAGENRWYYWMDLGNEKDFGQIIMGTIFEEKQPKSKYTTLKHLKHVVKVYPDIVNDLPGPESCSTQESLIKQDLFINKFMGTLAGNMIWRFLVDLYMDHNTVYFNLKNLLITKTFL